MSTETIIVVGFDFRNRDKTPDHLGTGFIARAFNDRTKACQFGELLASLGPLTRERKLSEIRRFIEGGTNHVELSGVDVAILENS